MVNANPPIDNASPRTEVIGESFIGNAQVRTFVDHNDPVTPSHYVSHKVTPTDLIQAYDLSFAAGCVIKYVSRAKEKAGVTDLRKALWYLVFEMTGSSEKANEATAVLKSMLDSNAS